jgi:hypothetical protein
MEVNKKRITYYPTQDEKKQWIVVGQESGQPPILAHEGSFGTKKEAEVVAKKLRVGNTIDRMEKTEGKGYDDIKREILKERGYTEQDFHKGVVSVAEANEIMSLATKRYQDEVAPKREDSGWKKLKEGGGVDYKSIHGIGLKIEDVESYAKDLSLRKKDNRFYVVFDHENKDISWATQEEVDMMSERKHGYLWTEISSYINGNRTPRIPHVNSDFILNNGGSINAGELEEFTSIPEVLKNFMPTHQQLTVSESIGSFQDEIKRLLEAVNELPVAYGTEGISENDKIAMLHYFSGGSDWYIVEKDTTDQQNQAFGLAILSGNYPELGYISIQEMIGNDKIELDFHFEPKKLGAIKGDEEKEDKAENSVVYEEEVLDFVNRLDVEKLPKQAKDGLSELIKLLEAESVEKSNPHYANFRKIIEEKYPEAIVEEDIEPTTEELKQLISGLKTQIKYADTPEEKKELEQILRGLSAMIG